MVQRARQERRGRAAGGTLDRAAAERVIRLRIAFVVVMGAAIAALPLFGAPRVALGLSVAVIGLTIDTYALAVLKRSRRPTLALALGDLGIALVVAAAVPESLPVTAVVIAGTITLYVLWYGPRTALVLAGVFELGMIVIGVVHNPPWWLASSIAFAIAAGASTTTQYRVARAAVEIGERYVSLVDGLDAVVWESDARGRVRLVSGNVEEVVGCAAEEFAAPDFYLSRIHPDDRGFLYGARARIAAGQATETHMRIRDDAGHYRRLQERVKVTLDSDGTVRSRRGFVVDESLRWEAESDLRRYVDFIHGIPVALTVLRLADPDDPRSLEIASVNPAAQRVVGFPAPNALLVDQIDIDDRWLARLAFVAQSGQPLEQPLVNLPGSDALFALRAVPLPDHHVGVTLEDVTKRARLEASFRHQAMHDELTGLPNRAQFQQRLTELLEGPSPRPSALLLVDLDQFKEINDALGHEYGDRLLREFARRLATSLRDCDLIARLGGDEFAVLLTERCSAADAREVAQRLLQLCEQRFEVGEYRFQVGVSVGVAASPEHAGDAETLMRRADAAMYRAKRSGGGAALYSPDHEVSTVRRLELMSDLRDALSSGAIEVHYQPRIDLQTGGLLGLEALARWRHPRHGMLPPAEFIELAEVSGCIRELTECVGETAAAEVGDILAEHELALGINLSARTLYDPRLADWVRQLLDSQSIPDGSLCFEITESQLMDDPGRSRHLLDDIRRLGVRFSVDDFGTGYSSLAHLRELPVDEIKIDRSFVAGVVTDDTIVRSIIDLGHNLGLHVVAEGVEDQATEDRLRALGCDSAQGFRWGPAVPLEVLRADLGDAWDPARALR